MTEFPFRKPVLQILWLFCFACTVVAEVFIVPKPKDLKYATGIFEMKASAGCQIATSDTTNLLPGVKQLQREYKSNNGYEIILGNKQPLMVRIGIPAENESFRELCAEHGLWPENRIGNEGYVLNISPVEILIAANTKTGIYYGIQSLKQILRSLENPFEIPCLKIVDWPDLGFRGVQDDISRGPVPTMAYMKSQVRRLSELKINRISYYTEHIVKTKSHGDFSPAGGGISIAEWKELNDYAADYHMEVVANFQSLGHFEKILSYPQYRSLGETERMLSPIRKESFQLLADIYAEMAPVFSSEYFNVNCDETWDLGRGASKKYTDSLGIGRVYADHILRIYNELNKHGKKTMIWGDIALSHPEILDMLPRDVMMGAWTYGADDRFEAYFEPFRAAGFAFLYSCGVLNSNRVMPDYRMTMANIKGFTSAARGGGTVGMLCTVWDDGGNAFFPLDWYGVAYAAEQSWHLNDDSISVYNRRFDRGIYGNHNGAISETFQTLIPITDLTETYEMNDLVLWKQVVPERGQTLSIDGSDWEVVAEIVQEADSLLNTAAPKAYRDDLLFMDLIIKEYDYLARSRFDLLKAAAAYKRACFIQKESRPQALQNVENARALIASARLCLVAVRDLYADLWLIESKPYWRDHIIEKFDAKIRDYEHAELLLEKSLGQFQNGEYLLPPNDIRLDIRELTGKYFQYWLLCGPFPNDNGAGIETDFLRPAGGESVASPVPGDFFQSESEGIKHWIKYASPLHTKIDFTTIFEKKDRAVAYAFCRIYSPVSQPVRATFGSNDGIQIYLNGEKVFKKYAKRSLILDEDSQVLHLKKGRNDLLLKLDQNKGGWEFSFRIPEHRVRNHKYKYYILESKD